MDDMPAYLQYGEIVAAEAGEAIFSVGNELGPRPIYYVVAGLVRLDVPSARGYPIAIYGQPDTIFGVVEVMAGTSRLMCATAVEKSILYCWDHESYQIAHNVSWELAFRTFTGMSRLLRILNAEYTEVRR
jgi:CRP-like cAMP-binding protein